jgi:hypothetical protein
MPTLSALPGLDFLLPANIAQNKPRLVIILPKHTSNLLPRGTYHTAGRHNLKGGNSRAH